MGADLILTWMRAPWQKGGKIPSLERSIVVGHERVEALVITEELRNNLFDVLNLEGDEELFGGLAQAEDVPGERIDERIRVILHETIDALVLESRRDVETITLDKTRWWFTGGMSWGDDPTDAYTLINRLAEIGLYDEAVPADSRS